MESTQNRIAYLLRFIELGHPDAQKAEEEESYQEAHDRLWSEVDQLTETDFYLRLARLSSLADQEAEERCPSCSCAHGGPACRFYQEADQSWSPFLDDEGPHEPFAPCCCAGFCTCDFDSISE